MDPVSIAASSIAFIGACRKLAAGFTFLRDLSRAPEEVLALTDELNDLQNVLTAVGLVTQRRRDELIGVLLSPLFAKIDQIVHELCDVCGACPQRLKEDREYKEELQLQLLARFKWTRAKKRVGELRERLKVLRLDFANALATIGLLDISHLTSQLNNLSVETSTRTPGQAVIDSDILPPYESNSMQITTASDPKSVDLEAQESQLDNPDECRALEQQNPIYHGSRSGSCERACSCACHSVYRVKTPSMLQNLVGSLLIKSNGLYGMNQACNEFSCRRSSPASIRISYRFPEWLLTRMISSVITSSHLSGPQLCLMAPRIVSNKSDIFSHAFAGNVGEIAKLFERGLASPCDISDVYGYTPLHYAVDKGHKDLCRFLLNAGARPDITDFDENSATDLAWNKICSKRISSGDAAELEELFKRDEWFEQRQFSLLHKIVLDLLPVRRSLDLELSLSTNNVELADSEGRTPLSWAAERGHVLAVKTLVRYGANAATKSIMGMTPLHYAAKAPTPGCLVALLDTDISVTAKNKWNQSALNIASYFQDDSSYIPPLLNHGADINETDSWGSTALSCAAYMNNTKTAQCLISHGAEINGQDHHGIKALNESIENNSHDCIALLLENGADPSIADQAGETALHIVARRADLRTLEIFRATDFEDIDTKAEGNAGLTPYDLLRQRVDCTEDLESVFRSLMARLEPKSIYVNFFDGIEKSPSIINKTPNIIEVSIKEIMVE